MLLNSCKRVSGLLPCRRQRQRHPPSSYPKMIELSHNRRLMQRNSDNILNLFYRVNQDLPAYEDPPARKATRWDLFDKKFLIAHISSETRPATISSLAICGAAIGQRIKKKNVTRELVLATSKGDLRSSKVNFIDQ